MSWIGHEPPIPAIYYHIQLLQHCLAYQHFINQDQSLFRSNAPIDSDHHRLGHIYRFSSAVSIRQRAPVRREEAKLLRNVGWNDQGHCTCIDRGLRFIARTLSPGNWPRRASDSSADWQAEP